jgi:hypothetical protein
MVRSGSEKLGDMSLRIFKERAGLTSTDRADNAGRQSAILTDYCSFVQYILWPLREIIAMLNEQVLTLRGHRGF